MKANETTPRPGVDTAAVIASVLCDGVVRIDALLQLDDPKLMKQMLQQHPINRLETVKAFYDTCRWGELRDWAVAHHEPELADFARHPSIPEANYHEGGFPRGFRKVCATYYRAGMINEKYLVEALDACTKDPYYKNNYLWFVPMQFPIFEVCKQLVAEKIEGTTAML